MSRTRWNWRRKCGVVMEVENDIKAGIPEETSIHASAARHSLELHEVKEWVYRYRKFGGLSLRRATGAVRFSHSAPLSTETR